MSTIPHSVKPAKVGLRRSPFAADLRRFAQDRRVQVTTGVLSLILIGNQLPLPVLFVG